MTCMKQKESILCLRHNITLPATETEVYFSLPTNSITDSGCQALSLAMEAVLCIKAVKAVLLFVLLKYSYVN